MWSDDERTASPPTPAGAAASSPARSLEDRYATLQKVLAAHRGPIFSVDRERRYTSFNLHHAAQMSALHGAAIELGQPAAVRHTDPKWWRRTQQGIDMALAGEDVVMELHLPDGEEAGRWFEVAFTPLRSATGEVSDVVVHGQDITEHKAAVEALRESEERFRLVLKNAPVSVAAQDASLRFRWAYNQRTLSSPSEALGKTDQDLFTPEDAAKLVALKRQVLETGTEIRDQMWLTRHGQRIFLDLFLEPLRDQDGSVTGVGVATVDLTAMKTAEEALQASEERYHALFSSMTEGFAIHEIICDESGEPADYRFVDINPSFERLTGLSRDDVVGARVSDLLPAESAFWVKMYGSVALTGEPVHFEEYSPALKRHFEVWAYRPAPSQFAALFIDITERKLAAQTLETIRLEALEEKNRLVAMMDALPVGAAILDENGGNIQSNAMFESIWGGPRPPARQVADYVAFRAWWADSGQPVEPEEWASAVAIRLGRPVLGQLLEIERLDGTRISVLNNAAPVLDPNHEVVGCVVAIMDVTRMREAEQRIEAALREKEVLLREIHHRVKNNLQIVASMLNLQASAIADPPSREPLIQSQHRVRTLALIHEKLYGSQDFARIPLRPYLEDLAGYLHRSYAEFSGCVALEVEAEDVWLDVSTAIPMALILNELLSNALKHAFPDGRRGHVKVTCRQRDDGSCELVVTDDGVGFPEGSCLGEAKSMGLRIVLGLTKQLGGEITLERDHGTRLVLVFTPAARA